MEITKSAVDELKKMLKDTDGKDLGIRVFISKGGCCGASFGIDIVEKGESGDKSITKDGVKIFISSDADEKLSGATIDFSEGGLIIRGMAPSSSCCR